MPRKKPQKKIIATASPYTFKQEELIDQLLAEKIPDLQHVVHDKKGVLSDRQLEVARRELEQYQGLQRQNRINRQINTKWR